MMRPDRFDPQNAKLTVLTWIACLVFFAVLYLVCSTAHGRERVPTPVAEPTPRPTRIPLPTGYINPRWH